MKRRIYDKPLLYARVSCFGKTSEFFAELQEQPGQYPGWSRDRYMYPSSRDGQTSFLCAIGNKIVGLRSPADPTHWLLAPRSPKLDA